MSIALVLASFVALLHVAFTGGIIVGFAALLAVGILDRQRAQDRRIRTWRRLHLLAVTYTLFRTWLGLPCPLRTLEDRLRAIAPAPARAITSTTITAPADVLAAWTHRLYFRGADHNRFTIAVSCFAALVFADAWLEWRIARAAQA